MIPAQALALEAELLVELDRGSFQEDVQLQLADAGRARPRLRLLEQGAPDPEAAVVAATISPRSATWRLALCGSRATEPGDDRAVVVGDEDGGIRVPAERAQVAALLADAAPAVVLSSQASGSRPIEAPSSTSAAASSGAPGGSGSSSDDDAVAAAARVAGRGERAVGRRSTAETPPK